MPDGKSPGRKRAEELGGAGSFEKDPDYDHAGGFPKGTPGQGGEYKDGGAQGPSSAPPAPQPKPFTLGE